MANGQKVTCDSLTIIVKYGKALTNLEFSPVPAHVNVDILSAWCEFEAGSFRDDTRSGNLIFSSAIDLRNMRRRETGRTAMRFGVCDDSDRFRFRPSWAIIDHLLCIIFAWKKFQFESPKNSRHVKLSHGITRWFMEFSVSFPMHQFHGELPSFHDEEDRWKNKRYIVAQAIRIYRAQNTMLRIPLHELVITCCHMHQRQ